MTKIGGKKSRPLLLALILVCAAVPLLLLFRGGRSGWHKRAPFIDAVANATTFEELDSCGTLIWRADGTWLAIQSEANYDHNPWTLVVDSSGRWWESRVRSYELSRAPPLYRRARLRTAESAMKRSDPTLDASNRKQWDAVRTEETDRLKELLPYWLEQAGSLDEARRILAENGFTEALALPRPKLAGAATRPAPAPATNPAPPTAPAPAAH